ncbi:MAG TPA: hypothetical protein VF198_12135 [Vicinamibacterales bacterium]
MTASRSLPPRPSLESLRKQARKLARARAVSLREAQLLLAREYGYAGWQDLTAEVGRRLGRDLEWALGQARRVIHDNDVDGLRQLVADYPALLRWRADETDGGLLGMAASPYAFDVGNPQRERDFTRAACAEVLIDAGAVVAPSVCESLLQSRARGLLALFQRKGVLPRTLEFPAALGDVDAVRTALDGGADAAVVNAAFVRACFFGQEAVASLLLERAIAFDPELGEEVDSRVGGPAFIQCFFATRAEHVGETARHASTSGLWKTFAMEQVRRSVEAGDVTAFVSGLQRHSWLLHDAWVDFQHDLIGCGRAAFIAALLDLGPAILRRRPPPRSHHIEYALIEGRADLVRLLTRIWPVPDDLPHAAGMGDLQRVKRWFDAEGRPALGDVMNHVPATSQHRPWDTVGVQEVLDTALAWAVINRHFDVADFLLARGANINTDWNSHEPASILHHLVFLPDPYESMQFLIDRGIDMTIRDYRWDSNAAGWARYGRGDEQMARWLEEAERRRAR